MVPNYLWNKKDRSMAVLAGRFHALPNSRKRWRFELADFKEAECVAYFCTADLDPQVDGRDEVFGWKRGAILSRDFESKLAWNEENEASWFALGAGLAEPGVAQLTTERYQSEPPRWAGVIRKGSTDPNNK